MCCCAPFLHKNVLLTSKHRMAALFAHEGVDTRSPADHPPKHIQPRLPNNLRLEQLVPGGNINFDLAFLVPLISEEKTSCSPLICLLFPKSL